MMEEIKGAMDIDCIVPLICNTSGKQLGKLSLQDICLKQFKMSDGHTLIAEIHQRRVHSPVEVIILNTKEAETRIAWMNKHLPVFCYYI